MLSSNYAFTRTQSPGRVADGFQLALAGLAGGDFLGRLLRDPSAQSGHQEPGVSLAAATQDAKSPSGWPSLQN